MLACITAVCARVPLSETGVAKGLLKARKAMYGFMLTSPADMRNVGMMTFDRKGLEIFQSECCVHQRKSALRSNCGRILKLLDMGVTVWTKSRWTSFTVCKLWGTASNGKPRV
jgi:hypothetical protein